MNQIMQEAQPALQKKEELQSYPATNKQGKPAILRQDLFDLIQRADLMQPLMHHLRSNNKRFIQLGVRGAANLQSAKSKTLARDFFFKLPDKAFAVIDEWLAKETVPELDDFLKEDEHNENALREQLLGLQLYRHELTAKPTGHKQRARLLIACNYRSSHHELFCDVIQAGRDPGNQKPSPGKGKYDDIMALVENPASMMANQTRPNHVPSWMIACAVAVHFQQREDADMLLDKLRTISKKQDWEPSVLQAVTEHYDSTMAKGQMPAVKMGYASDGEFASLIDLEVLAKCTMLENRHEDAAKRPFAFSKVLAVKHRDSSEWKELKPHQAEQLFPNLGSFIHFSGNQHPGLPEHSSYAVWRVEPNAHNRQNEDNKPDTTTHATALVMPVQQISSLENISSVQIKDLRSWLEQNASGYTGPAVNECKLLHTSDGLFIHPADSYEDTIAGSFMMPFRAWKKLKVHQLNSGLNLHIGELPDTNIKHDLSHSNELVKKSLRQYAMLGRDERGKLAAVLGELAKNEHYQSLIAEFGVDKLQWHTENFRQLVDQLRAVDQIREKLSEKESRQLAAAETNQAERRSELDQELDHKKQVQQRNTERIKQLSQQTAEELDGYIEKYFDRISGLSNRFKRDGSPKRKWFPEIDAEMKKLMKRISDLDSLVKKNGETPSI